MRDGISRNPLGREFQRLTTLLVKKDLAIFEVTNLEDKRPVPLLDIDFLEFRFNKFLKREFG